MPSNEIDLMKTLQIAASQLGARLFRQQVGQAWVGRAERIAQSRMVKVNAGDVVIRGARPFRAGIVGMSDLGGWVPITVTPEMVGQTVAVYAQVEVKDGARPTEEQLRWVNAVLKAGGLAGIAHNILELEAILTAKGRSKE